MSARTAKASSAVRKAWENERDLVSKGRGTRDWNPDQQQDILNKGKAYDENGKAYQGHHMKSAVMYPEFQGDPENIQFLTRTEHKAAHGGNFQIPTNGYFDPATNVTIEFGDGPYKPCEIIELSEPVYGPRSVDQNTNKNVTSSSGEHKDSEKSIKEEQIKREAIKDEPTRNNAQQARDNPPPRENSKPDPAPKKKKRIISMIGNGIKKVGKTIKKAGNAIKHAGDWAIDNPEKALTIAGAAVGALFGAAATKDSKSNNGESNNSSSGSESEKNKGQKDEPKEKTKYTENKDSEENVKKKKKANEDEEDNANDNEGTPEERREIDYPDKRASPIEHEVRGYTKKNGTHVAPYTRGKKKNE